MTNARTPSTSGGDKKTGRSSRRAFLASGMATGALITSLSSRSAFAAQCTASAALSGNLSGQHLACDSFDANFWISAATSNPSIWPEGFAPSASFSGLFGTKLNGNTYFQGNVDYSLLQVLQGNPDVMPASSPAGVALEAVVAFLNAAFFGRPDVHYVFSGGISENEVASKVSTLLGEGKKEDNITLLSWLQALNSSSVIPSSSLG